MEVERLPFFIKMINLKISVNTPSFIKLENIFQNDDIMKAWGVIYRSYLQRRCNSFSKGGGSWAPLKYLRKRNRKAALKKQNKSNGTKSKRLKNGNDEAAKQTILRDTGILFNALSPNLTGSGFEEIKNNTQLIIGFSPAQHQGTKRSISEIASFHQYGTGNNPVREIIVPPDEKTLNKMTEVVLKHIK